MSEARRPSPRRIAVLALPGAQTLDVTGPAETFGVAAEVFGRAGRPAPYEVEILGEAPGPVRTGSGIRIHADRGFRDAGDEVDTLIVAGGDRELLAWRKDRELLAWLRGMDARVRRIGSVCTGALLLAEAGILAGRRATTHWLATDRLAAYPDVDVDPDAIFVRDGHVATSAGITSGMDLALALVEEDLGRDVALLTARVMVLFLKRPGGQSQFSAPLAAQVRATGPLERLPAWILEHLAEDLSVPVLARQTAMSPRHFARVFVEQLGVTPARWVERARVERAREELEAGTLRVEEIAVRCGFGSADHMRRAFQRNVEVTPQDYRRRFGAPTARRPRAAPAESRTERPTRATQEEPRADRRSRL